MVREEMVLEEENSEEEDEDRNYFPGIAVELGHCGVIAVLLETPSGFAVFNYDGVKLFLPDAVEDIWTESVNDNTAKTVVWLKEFQNFEDKASAINTNTGVDARLANMIKGCLKPEQKLAVGSYEHAQIIKENLGISCLFGDAVLELMWGLKNCLNSLVPGELTKGDRPPMCKGMRNVLDKFYYDYKPEMVNDDLTEVVCLVYDCDYSVHMHFDTLHRAGKQLMNISEINSEDWDLLKLVTALKWVCYPEEELVIDPIKGCVLFRHVPSRSPAGQREFHVMRVSTDKNKLLALPSRWCLALATTKYLNVIDFSLGTVYHKNDLCDQLCSLFSSDLMDCSCPC